MPQATTASGRNDFSDRDLLRVVALCLGLIVAWFAALRWMPDVWRQPGSMPVYLVGVAGTLLILMPVAFSLMKRAGRSSHPVAWFNAHIWCASLGTVLIAVHSCGYMRRPPALLLLALVALIALGVWGRVRGSRFSARTFGTAAPAFAQADPERRARLRSILDQKLDVLSRLQPDATEGTFSVTLAHWIAAPRLASAYVRLVREERRLVGRRDVVDPRQAWWRPLHIALACLFVIGVLIHVVTVTFFAGYVADGGPITWWYITDW